MKACCNMFAVFQQKLDRCMHRIQAFFFFGDVMVFCTICWTESHFIKKPKKKKLFDKTYANPPLCKVPVLFLTFS